MFQNINILQSLSCIPDFRRYWWHASYLCQYGPCAMCISVEAQAFAKSRQTGLNNVWSEKTHSQILRSRETKKSNSLVGTNLVKDIGRASICASVTMLRSRVCTLLVLNSSGPSDAIWRQRSGSTLAQVMACCLTASSHYLNQYWLIISKVQWHSTEIPQPLFTKIR